MNAKVLITPYGRPALDALRDVVAGAKRDDPMASVTLVVPNNLAGITVRRHLAHGLTESGQPGVAGLNVSTLPRLAEQLAAPALARRRPATRPVVGAAWRAVLTDDPGVFGDVAEHPATIRALTQAHHRLRDLSDGALDTLAPSTAITPDLVRQHRTVTERLAAGWYDTTELLTEAARTVAAHPERARELGTIVLYEPQDLTQAAAGFATELARHTDLTVVAALTGVARADGAVRDTLTRLGLETPGTPPKPPTATQVLNASDSDDEVRCVVRDLVQTLRTTPAHRIAVLYGAASPYARLVHEQLGACGIAVNGPGVRPVDERAVARVLTETLALADADVPRADLFRALANAPTRDFAGDQLPLSAWERISRSAGVVAGGDWDTRLTALIEIERARITRLREDEDRPAWMIERSQRTVDHATGLHAFVAELRTRLRHAETLTSWRELSAWTLDLFHSLLGDPDTLVTLPAEEQHAAANIELTLRGLTSLDAFGRPASPRDLRDVLDLELAGALPRVGTFGNGVLVAPLSAAVGLDLDVVYVLGLAEDVYPGRLREDALLPERARAATGDELPSHRERLHARHRHLLAAVASAGRRAVTSFARGDLRRSSNRLPSRWLLPTLRELAGDTTLAATAWQDADYRGAVTTSPSFAGTLTSTPALASEQEWRVRALAARGGLDDPVVEHATALLRARASDAFTRFDGDLTGQQGLPDHAHEDRPVSPTALEAYVSCPHGYFVQRMLGVTPVEQPEEVVQISPADIGSLMHESLDDLIGEYAGALPDYGRPWTPAQRARLSEIAQAKAEQYENGGLTGHPRLWEREKVRILDDLARMLTADDAWRAGLDARVVTSEMPFGMRGAPPVEVAVRDGRILMRGSADKVDAGRDGTLYVTDVKTGSTRTFDGLGEDDPTLGGTKLQLPVYAHAARAWFGEAGTPVRALYWFVRRDLGRIEVPLTRAVERTYAEVLGVVVSSIAAGLFPPRAPEKPDFAWTQCDYCNPDGLGHAAVRERWERKRHDPALAAYVRLAEPDALRDDGDGPA